MPILTLSYLFIVFVGWLLRAYGKDVVAYTKDMVQGWFKYAMDGNNILILGPAQSGKTSLILLITEDRPFKMEDGKIVEPEPTFGIVLVDKIANLSKTLTDSKATIKNDVGGDKIHSDLWAELIETVDPEGIIYVVDGSKNVGDFISDVERLTTDVMKCYENKKRSFKTLHVFINFMDKWSKNDRGIITEKESIVKQYIVSVLKDSKFRKLEELDVVVSTIHLNPKAKSWKEAKRALHAFGASLEID